MSRVTSMAADVYWATLNSKQDLAAPSIPLWVRLVEANKHFHSDHSYIRGLRGSAK